MAVVTGPVRWAEPVPSARRPLQRRIQKYVLNPGMRMAIGGGYAPGMFALIETTGRRTGLQRLTPVTVAADGKARRKEMDRLTVRIDLDA
jgi:hypothetical protein